MTRLKRGLGWLAAGLGVVAVGALVWNLPQGKHTEVVPMEQGSGVLIGRADPGVDQDALDRARTVEDLKKVKGMHWGEPGP